MEQIDAILIDDGWLVQTANVRQLNADPIEHHSASEVDPASLKERFLKNLKHACAELSTVIKDAVQQAAPDEITLELSFTAEKSGKVLLFGLGGVEGRAEGGITLTMKWSKQSGNPNE